MIHVRKPNLTCFPPGNKMAFNEINVCLSAENMHEEHHTVTFYSWQW